MCMIRPIFCSDAVPIRNYNVSHRSRRVVPFVSFARLGTDAIIVIEKFKVRCQVETWLEG